MEEETIAHLPEELVKEWKRLQGVSGSFKGPPKDEADMQQRKDHKATVKQFLAGLTVEQRNVLIPPKKKANDAAKNDKHNKAPLQHILEPKESPVNLGWGECAKQYSHVLSFYSHTRRYPIEEYEDEHIFGDLDRRVLSNLFEDDRPIQMGQLTGTHIHPLICETPAASSEHFYQAVKCQEEADAEFILTQLNSLDAARFGQSRLLLTSSQKEWLVARGINADDFQPRGSGWMRGKKGQLPARRDWRQIKHSVMLHILRAKFGGQALGTAARRAVEALKVAPLFVEHTTNDAAWGDGGSGNGTNWLGKCLTRVFLELKGQFPVDPQANETNLFSPNNLLVRYVPTSVPIKNRTLPTDHLPSPDVLLILDFEATCDKGGNPKPQEIIEWPTLALSVATGKVEKVFHHYVKPTIKPVLSDFCTELTGITQSQVDAGKPLIDVMQMHLQWLSDNRLVPLYDEQGSPTSCTGEGQRTFLYTSCGDWDLRTGLATQLSHLGVPVPSTFSNWINVKIAFQNVYASKKPGGMAEMLKRLGLELEGHHHSGIDDCRNIAMICQALLKDEWVPTRTSMRR
ncbi:ERI1 exoribonuclease [Seminavis robusta]|uniref:ERI1 exoribonuclease n=1 Tax=Seminavis robusta TaxID=568900 RepID=A0A9N8EES9_9STRA|nr:ERI1 exoribonuclease [Seminavis robusta]|eukprot:Sro988_g228300.1 ERI1 exoribonuclease (571) ;mRNA; r:2098-3985